jgi:hypothetical protein
MIFDHAASLLTPRFRQRIHEPRKETFALFYLWALGNGSAGDASAPIGHGIHQVFPSRECSADSAAFVA